MDLNFADPQFYINRELSWLAFEERVLEEAADEECNILERLKFMSISASNLDEFFMVRVASLHDMKKLGYEGEDLSGMSTTRQLEEIAIRAHSFTENQYGLLKNTLFPILDTIGVKLYHDLTTLSETERSIIKEYFDLKISHKLNIEDISSISELNHVQGGRIYCVFRIDGINPRYLLVQVPKDDNRVYAIESGDTLKLILLEDIILYNLSRLYGKAASAITGCFRILRDADVAIDTDDNGDLLQKIRHLVELREESDTVKLEISQGFDENLKRDILKTLLLEDKDVYEIEGPLDLTFLSEVYSLDRLKSYREKRREPIKKDLFESVNPFNMIADKDIMLVHPYESFEPVIDLINAASEDSSVVAINQTLYRVGAISPVVHALAKAARNGKKVTVLVELKARFDEEHNIGWAEMLKKSGCEVLFSPVGVKIHCKLLQIIREENGIRKSYIHLGTGNYNELTAGIYTDIGLMCDDDDISRDISKVFEGIKGKSFQTSYESIYVAPSGLRERFIELIDTEIANAKKGYPAGITAKLNSLCDGKIIEKLYEASHYGVKIKLIVRGICTLRPGIKNISENITVRSIVGRYLEHSRIYRFENGGNPSIYCSSADWMSRNMDRRIEVLFPVRSDENRNKIDELLLKMLRDNVKARILDANGEYHKYTDGEAPYCYQEEMSKQKG